MIQDAEVARLREGIASFRQRIAKTEEKEFLTAFPWLADFQCGFDRTPSDATLKEARPGEGGRGPNRKGAARYELEGRCPMTPHEADTVSLPWLEDFQGGEGVLPSDDTFEDAIHHVEGLLIDGRISKLQEFLGRLDPDRMHLLAFDILLEGARRHGASLPFWEARRKQAISRMGRRHHG